MIHAKRLYRTHIYINLRTFSVLKNSTYNKMYSFPLYLLFAPYTYFGILDYFHCINQLLEIFNTIEIFRYLTTSLSSSFDKCTDDLHNMVRMPPFQEYSFLVKYNFRYVFLENKKYELLHKVFYESYHMLARFSLNMINDVHVLRFLHPFFK